MWTGFDTPEVVRPVSVGNPAATLFRKVMQPLHEGKERMALYDPSGMITVSVCLDSGKLATEACKNDGRDLTRVASARVYPEDAPSGRCDKHVTVKYCSGGGEATEWCEKFAEVDDTVKIEESSYVYLTKDEYNAAAKAVGWGLSKEYINEDFVIVENKNEEGKECPLHTKEAWEEYEASQATEPSEPIEPTVPTAPTDPVVPAA